LEPPQPEAFSMSDLDLPLLPSAEQIRRREFATIRRGYDPDQVRDYLTAVAHQVENLEKEARELRLKGAEATSAPVAAKTEEPAAAPAADPYEELGKRFAGLIGSADAEAHKILEEAKAEASRLLEEARTETDRIRVDAQSHAEEARQAGKEALEKAKLEAQRMLAGLANRRENLVTQLQQMQSKLLTVAKDLEVTIDEPLQADLTDEAESHVAAESFDSQPTDGPKDEPTAPPPDAAQDEVKNPSDSDKGAQAQTVDVVDPAYEDLWVSTDTVDLPDLASIELDFEEETPKKSE
jgi:DivIVA domain-containing protein